MADQKISQLPAASLPLTGAELAVLVQGGADVQTAISNVRQTVATPQIKIANFAASGSSVGLIYLVRTSLGAITATLDATPAQWDIVEIIDMDGNAATDPVTVALNGNNYNGSSVNPSINIAYARMRIMFNGTNWGDV